MVTAWVSYRYKKPDSRSWTSTQSSFRVNQQSEALLMQEMRRTHPGHEIELLSIKWQ